MGELLYLAETTLLWMVGVFFLAGIVLRSLFFVFCILRPRPFGRRGIMHRFITLFGVFAPFHRAVLKKPVYTAIRYVFHACLFLVPIWFSGHVYMWEESRFEWYWTPLPDAWADWMTLFVLTACAFFFARRIIFGKNRFNAGISDFLLILITGLPFLTGYLLTHGGLNSISFFENYLWYIHLISGEIMLVAIIFLFLRTRLKKAACVGCAACVESCPAETLEFYDQGAFRFFRYSHYQCICCGSCVNVCPEQAAELRHEIRPFNLIKIASKREIRQVELTACEQCGVRFAPMPQLDKLNRRLNQNDVEISTLSICQRCKKLISQHVICSL
jgi:formate hydrogenlyase subunit 6/NADH:ubiquinone oxidoreductase subunit I